MGYDPEVEMEMQSILEGLRAGTQHIRDLAGDDHPGVKLLASIDDCFDIINDLRNEAVNCFDEEEKKRIKVEAKNMIAFVSNRLQEIQAFLERKQNDRERTDCEGEGRSQG